MSRRAERLEGWAGRLGLLVLSSLLAVGLAEVLCRQFVSVGSFHWQGDAGDSWSEQDQELGYRLKAGWRGWLEAPEYRHRVEINSRGFRGEEPGAEPAVWMLGDSFVFGVGVEAKDSLPGRLEAELAGGSLKVPVWNLGVPSWSGEQYRRELERRFADARPAAVVVVFFLGERTSGANDLIGAQDFLLELGARASRPIPAAESEPPPKLESLKKWLGRHSALYNAIVSRFGPGLRGLVRRHSEMEPEERERIEKGWLLLDEELRRFAAFASREGVPFLVVAMPEVGDLARGDSPVGRRFLDLAEKAGLPAVDLSPALTQQPFGEISYSRDGHLKPEGNRVAAVAIAGAFAGSASVPPAPEIEEWAGRPRSR